MPLPVRHQPIGRARRWRRLRARSPGGHHRRRWRWPGRRGGWPRRGRRGSATGRDRCSSRAERSRSHWLRSTTMVPGAGSLILPSAREAGRCSARGCARGPQDRCGPLDISAAMKPNASTGLACTTSSGMAVSHAANGGLSCSVWRCSAGTASSARSAARSTSPAASACRTAGTGSPASSNQSPARRCKSCTSPGVRVEVGPQDLGEQVVVPVPVAAVVERNEEQVGAVQALEHVLAAVLPVTAWHSGR